MADRNPTFRIRAIDETAAGISSAAASLKSLEAIGARLQSTLAGIGVGVGAGEFVRDIASRTIAAERALNGLTTVLKTTGYAAGVTASQVQQMIEELSANTAFDDTDITRAANALLRFREISGSAFEQALRLAPDVAVALGTDVAGAATALGRAVQAPESGMRAIREAGVKLAQSQIDLAKAFAETGDRAGAAQVALDAIAASVGGAAAGENKGLYGSSRATAKAYDELLRTIGGSKAIQGAATSAMRYISGALKDLQDDIEHFQGADTLQKKFVAVVRALSLSAPDRRSLDLTFTPVVQPTDAAQLSKQRAEVADAALGAHIAASAAWEEAYLERKKKANEEAQKAAEAYGRAIDGIEKGLQNELLSLTKATELDKVRAQLAGIRNVKAGDRAAIEALAAQADAIKNSQELGKELSDQQKDRAEVAAAENRAEMDRINAIGELRLEQEKKYKAALESTYSATAAGKLEEQRAELLRLKDLFEQGRFGDTGSKEATDAITKELERVRDLGKEMKKTGELGAMMGYAFTSRFEDAVLSGEKLSKVIDGLGRDIERIILHQLITAPIGAFVGGLVSKIFPGFASGGVLAPGEWGIVGEKGPEFAYGGTAGMTISSNGAGPGGSVSIVQNISVDSRSDRASIMQAMAVAKDQAKAEILDSRRRGGAFA